MYITFVTGGDGNTNDIWLDEPRFLLQNKKYDNINKILLCSTPTENHVVLFLNLNIDVFSQYYFFLLIFFSF